MSKNAATLYDHLGVTSRPMSATSGETLLATGPAHCTAAGLSVAPVGLAFEHGVATYGFTNSFYVPVNLALHLRAGSSVPNAVRWESQTERAGRTALFTSGSLWSFDGQRRRIGFGSIIWSATGPSGGENVPFAPTDDVLTLAPGSGRPLPDVVGVQRDGLEVKVGAVRTDLAGPGGILHAGVLQVLVEEAALVATREVLGGHNLMVRDCVHHFTAPGKVGPFVARGRILASNDYAVDVEARVLDQGSNSRTCVFSHLHVVMGDG